VINSTSRTYTSIKVADAETTRRRLHSVKEVGNHHGQEAGQKCGFVLSRNKWTFGSRSLLCQEFRRRREETAWSTEKNRDKSSTYDVYVMCKDVHCF